MLTARVFSSWKTSNSSTRWKGMPLADCVMAESSMRPLKLFSPPLRVPTSCIAEFSRGARPACVLLMAWPTRRAVASGAILRKMLPWSMCSLSGTISMVPR